MYLYMMNLTTIMSNGIQNVKISFINGSHVERIDNVNTSLDELLKTKTQLHIKSTTLLQK